MKRLSSNDCDAGIIPTAADFPDNENAGNRRRDKKQEKCIYSQADLWRYGYGPSSSHTMGPHKAGLFFRKLTPNAVAYRVILFKSLALTGKGHSTDSAVIRGLSGIGGDDPTIPKLMDAEKHIQIIWNGYKFAHNAPPNVMYIEAYDKDMYIPSRSIVVESPGGGSIDTSENPNSPMVSLKKEIIKNYYDIVLDESNNNIFGSAYVDKVKRIAKAKQEAQHNIAKEFNGNLSDDSDFSQDSIISHTSTSSVVSGMNNDVEDILLKNKNETVAYSSVTPANSYHHKKTILNEAANFSLMVGKTVDCSRRIDLRNAPEQPDVVQAQTSDIDAASSELDNYNDETVINNDQNIYYDQEKKVHGCADSNSIDSCSNNRSENMNSNNNGNNAPYPDTDPAKDVLISALKNASSKSKIASRTESILNFFSSEVTENDLKNFFKEYLYCHCFWCGNKMDRVFEEEDYDDDEGTNFLKKKPVCDKCNAVAELQPDIMPSVLFDRVLQYAKAKVSSDGANSVPLQLSDYIRVKSYINVSVSFGDNTTHARSRTMSFTCRQRTLSNDIGNTTRATVAGSKEENNTPSSSFAAIDVKSLRPYQGQRHFYQIDKLSQINNMDIAKYIQACERACGVDLRALLDTCLNKMFASVERGLFLPGTKPSFRSNSNAEPQAVSFWENTLQRLCNSYLFPNRREYNEKGYGISLAADTQERIWFETFIATQRYKEKIAIPTALDANEKEEDKFEIYRAAPITFRRAVVSMIQKITNSPMFKRFREENKQEYEDLKEIANENPMEFLRKLRSTPCALLLESYSSQLIYAFSTAVSEENACGGEIVVAPTCGACGIVPGVLYYYKLLHELDDNLSKSTFKDKLIDALTVAGHVANIAKTNASISGARHGCQAEVGTATSMAAAALVYLDGGSFQQIDYAAAQGLEQNANLSCDPIKGLVVSPCISRNGAKAIEAYGIVYGNVALHDRIENTKNIIEVSYDCAVLVMKRSGEDMDDGYKETSKKGFAKYYKKYRQE